MAVSAVVPQAQSSSPTDDPTYQLIQSLKCHKSSREDRDADGPRRLSRKSSGVSQPAEPGKDNSAEADLRSARQSTKRHHRYKQKSKEVAGDENDKVLAELCQDEQRAVAEAILQKQLALYRKTQGRWDRTRPDLSSQVLQRHVRKVRRSYGAFRDLEYTLACQYRSKLFDPLINTGTLQMVCDVLLIGFQDNCYCQEKNGSEKAIIESQAELLNEGLLIVSSFTDTSSQVRRAVVGHGELLPLLANKLDVWHGSHVKGTLTDIEEKFVKKSLTIFFMVSAEDESTYLRDINNFFPVFKKYLSSEIDENRLTAIAVLANVAQEAEAQDIATDPDTVRFLLDQLRQTFSDDSRVSSTGWTTVGLSKVVKNLAKNDANKQLLVNEGALPLLIEGLKPEYQKSKDSEEKKWCLESLWWLCFDPQNRREVTKSRKLLDLVVAIYKDGPTSQCFTSAEGILFQLRDDLGKTDRYTAIAKKLIEQTEKSRRTREEADCPTSQEHVMISYQSQYRPTVQMICDYLQQNGINVWLDVYKMAEGEESTLQTMAEAVEGAKVVLVCVSESYRNSPYCRHEAEYAFTRRKHILPVKVQKGYTPDGWLGLIQGAKYVYDFVRDDPDYTDNKKRQLLEAIRKIYAGKEPEENMNMDNRRMSSLSGSSSCDSSAGSPRSEPLEPQTAKLLDKVKCWTKKDVQAWLRHHSLKGRQLETLKSSEILYLYELKLTAPEIFHKTLKSDLGLSLNSRSAFNTALSGLPEFLANT